MKTAWPTKKLGDVCLVVAGQSPEGRYYNKSAEGLPFYQGKKEFTEKYIGEPVTWTTAVTKEAQAGDILMSVRAPVGPINFTREHICIGRGLAAIRASDLIDRDYLFHFLKHHEDKIVGSAGAVFNSISRAQIENIKIPLPPLPEQRRIVKILDEVFEKTAKAKYNTEQNLQNSRDLFESYLQNIFAKPSRDWEEQKLGDVYDVRDGTHDSPKYQKEGFTFVTSKNLKRDGLDLSDVRYISGKDFAKINERSKVDKGDVLFAMIGTIGNPTIVDSDPSFAIKNVALFKVPKSQDNYFLKYYLGSRSVIDKMMQEAKGTTQKFVGLGYLRNYLIMLPPLSEQKIIVSKLNGLLTQTRELEMAYNRKLDSITELKKSVLHQAFTQSL